MKKYDDLVVNGDTDKEEVRKLISGLRLLRAYGRIADAALRALDGGSLTTMSVPLLERRSHTSKGRYEMVIVPVHRKVAVPPLPDYSSIAIELRPLKNSVTGKLERDQFLVCVKGPALGVHKYGRVTSIACDADIGGVWPRKSRISWNFRNTDGVKSGKVAVNKAIAHAASYALVKLCDDGLGHTGYSQAKQVHAELRARAEARLLLDGHADRIRLQVEGTVNVESVHSL